MIKEGEWVVFDLHIGIATKIGRYDEFTDGYCTTSGQIASRMRPLTLRNKVIIDSFKYYYDELGKIDGQIGFNYPEISSYFSSLSLNAIDSPGEEGPFHDLVKDFLSEAKKYTPIIQDIKLFRRAA